MENDEDKQTRMISISRPAYSNADLEEVHPREPTTSDSAKSCCKCKCSAGCVKDVVLGKLPFINIMRTYKVKEWLLNDLIAGISVGVIHIPQGMGFALLTSLPPVYGLYASLFPVVLYFFFGTSHHISMGTMAVISLMIGAIVDQQVTKLGLPVEPSQTINSSLDSLGGLTTPSVFEYSAYDMTASMTLSNSTGDFPEQFDLEGFKVNIATSVSLLMGLWQIGMSLLNLGGVATFMSMTFIGGFLTGAAVHIITSQVPSVFGIKFARPTGTFSLPLSWFEICRHLPEANVADIVISIICLTFLIVMKEVINVRYASKMKAPIPAELIIVVIAAVISYFCALDDRFGVVIIGNIPKGLPMPTVPSMLNVQDYLVDSFIIAIISFAVSIAMAKLFSRKHGYAIDQNQELFASGMIYGVSAFFQCFAGAQAPPRTLVQESAGGKTQVAGLFSSLLVLLVCLLIGPAFQPLPKSVLASIIIVALLPLFKQFKDLKQFWIINKNDFFTWVITFIVTVVCSMTLGLVVGVAFSLLTIIIASVKTRVVGMDRLEQGIYRPTGSYHQETHKMSDRVKIVRFEAPLFFANFEKFRAQVLGVCDVDLAKAKKEKQVQVEKVASNGAENGECSENLKLNMDDNQNEPSEAGTVVIVDASGMAYVDLQGLGALKQLHADLGKVGITLTMAACSDAIIDKLNKMGINVPLYPTIDDAIESHV